MLEKLGKFSPGFLRPKKSLVVHMYLKFDLFLHRMPCTLCWLSSSSSTAAIYSD